MVYSQTTGISQTFVAMLPVILSEQVWAEKSNQTALVFLLKVYLQKDCNLFLVDDRLQRLFAIFRSLCQRKSSRVDGLELLAHILQNLPMASLQPFLSYCVDILVLLSGVRLLRHLES